MMALLAHFIISAAAAAAAEGFWIRGLNGHMNHRAVKVSEGELHVFIYPPPPSVPPWLRGLTEGSLLEGCSSPAPKSWDLVCQEAKSGFARLLILGTGSLEQCDWHMGGEGVKSDAHVVR